LSVFAKNSVEVSRPTRTENKILTVSSPLIECLRQTPCHMLDSFLERREKNLLLLEESNVEQRRVKVQKLEEVHLECENVFQFGLCPRHLCQHKKAFCLKTQPILPSELTIIVNS